jgi:tyrosyl-tRNA synthetase
MTEHQQDESKRVAQHKLAYEFTELVHGLGAAEECVKQHRALFDSKNMSLDEIIAMATKQQPTTESAIDGHPAVTKNAKPQSLEKYSTVQGELPRGAVIGKPLSHVLWSAGLAASKTEAQKLINNKGAYIGAQSTGKGTMNDSLSYSAIQSSAWTWWKDFIIDDHLLILRTGKWRVKIINLINDQDFVAKGLSCPGWGEAPSTPLEGAAPQSVPAARSSIPHIESEADTVDSHGWDSMTRLKMNKETKKLLADEHAAMRKRTHDEGRSVLAPEKEYIPIGGVLARSPTYTRPPKRQL